MPSSGFLSGGGWYIQKQVLCRNLSTFKPAVAREIVKKFYFWGSFVNDFKDTVENIMNN